MIKIIADSSCDIREIEEIAKGLTFSYVPLKIMVGDQEFVDDDSIDVDEMYKALAAYDGKTSTACPSPDEYEKAFEDADEVYVVTISSNLSGSYNAANIAKEMHLEKYPNKKIQIFDSLSTSGTMALAIYKINDLIKQGNQHDEIVNEVQDYMVNHTNMDFVLHSVNNLVKNGRLSKIVGGAINVLGIKIVGRASEQGTLEPFAKIRGNNKIIKSIMSEFETKGYKQGKVIISHANNMHDAEALKNTILSQYPKADIEIVAAKGLVSYYAEEKGILIGFEY